MVTRQDEQPTWLPKMGIFIASINKCGDSGPWRWDNCTELDDKLRSCKFHVQQVYISSTINLLSQSGDRNHHMISQCLESGVLFANPNINGARTSCLHYRYKHDSSTLHKSRYIPSYTWWIKVLHIDSRVAHEVEVMMHEQQGTRVPLWRLWCFPTRGTEGIYQCTGTSSQQLGFGKVSTRQD